MARGAPGGGAAAAAPPRGVRIDLRAVRGAGPQDGRLVATPLGLAENEALAGVVAERLSGDRLLALPASTAWSLRLEAEGFWSPPAVVLPEDSAVVVHAWPTARITGTLAPIDGGRPPTQLTARVESPPETAGTSPIPRSEIPCRVEDSAFSCELPAAALDLRLRAPGFISHYRWGLRVKPGEERSLGKLALRPGASVSGWVVPTEGRESLAEARVELAPQTTGGNPRHFEAARKHGLTAEVTDRGFFHLEGVPPGRYELTASREGFAPAKRTIQVLEGSEAMLRAPLELARPVDLVLRLTPPLDPWNRPWQIWLVQGGAYSLAIEDSLPQSPASEAGIWKVEGLARGEYTVEISASRGALFAQEYISLEPGRNELPLEVPVVAVSGRVLLGDEPLAAALTFTHGEVSGAARISMESDETGEFSGLLPGVGRWWVEVEAESAGVRRSVKVEVVPRNYGAEGRAEIRLPNATIEGIVVREDGSPLESALISLEHYEDTSVTKKAFSDADGRFRFAGLEPGAVALSADTRALASDLRFALAAEGEPGAPVRLVMHGRRTVRGRVLSAAGPVPGARIEVQLRRGGVLSLERISARSAVDGGFELPLPRDAEDANFTVFAPGFALETARAPLVEGRPVTLEVDQVGGSLVLEGLTEDDFGSFAERWPFVLLDGIPIARDRLVEWAIVSGLRPDPEHFQVPMIAPASVMACVGVQQDLLRIAHTGASAAAHCRGGGLPAFGELKLDLSRRTEE